MDEQTYISVDPGRSTRVAALVAVAVITVIYFGFPCHRYFVDGLNDAYRLETSQGWAIHPNHPLMPLLPQVLYRWLGGDASGLSALGVLLVWATFFGVLGCLGMFMVLRAARLSIASILVAFGIFAFSAGVWYFNATADQYSTPLAVNVFTLLALVLVMRRPHGASMGQAVGIGILCGIAVLAHQVNGLMLIPAGYVVMRGDGTLRQKMVRLLAMVLMAVLVGGGGTILMGRGLLGLRSVADFRAWEHSYVTNEWYWAHGIMDSIRRSWRGAVELHVTHVFDEQGHLMKANSPTGTPQWYKWLGLKIGQVAVILFLLVETVRVFVDWARMRSLSSIQTLGLVAWIPGMIFCSIFTPEWTNYRIFYLPSLLLVLMPAMERHFRLLEPTLRRSWPALLIVPLIFAANFSAKFYHDSNAANNPYRSEARRLAEMVGPGDLVILSSAPMGYMRSAYVHYFTRCDILLVFKLVEEIRSSPEAVIKDLQNRIAAGRTILAHEDALYSDIDVELTNRYYGMDIRPDEVADFFDEYVKPKGYIVINNKAYLVISSPEFDNVPEEGALRVARDAD